MVTDFLPSRSPALPFHTANATGTFVPGFSSTVPCPVGASVRRKKTVYVSARYTPLA